MYFWSDRNAACCYGRTSAKRWGLHCIHRREKWILSDTWQTVVHFLLGPVPQVNVTDDAMWFWRGLVLPSLEFNIRIREFNLIWETAKHAETRSKGHLLSCHTCKNRTMRCRAQSATQSSISMVPLVSIDCLTAICHSRKQRIPWHYMKREV